MRCFFCGLFMGLLEEVWFCEAGSRWIVSQSVFPPIVNRLCSSIAQCEGPLCRAGISLCLRRGNRSRAEMVFDHRECSGVVRTDLVDCHLQRGCRFLFRQDCGAVKAVQRCYN